MILDDLANAARRRVIASRESIPFEKVKEKALGMECDTGFPFEKALSGPDISFICEVKKASPSKGIIAEEFPYMEIAREYERAGAAAISVLTETDYFLGSPQYLKEIAAEVKIPVLRKDFTVDEYQIYEAKILGAKAVLLIVALLQLPVLKKYMENPVVEEIPTETVINPNVDNWLMSTKGRDKNEMIYQLLTLGDPYLALIFANTRQRAEEITDYLQQQGLKVALIHGGLEPRARKRIMRQIHNLDYQYVVATDLAARGIDIDGVSLVINDDIPSDLEYFVHRVGRTGRANMKGTAITLYAPAEDEMIAKLEERGIKFTPKTFKNGQIVTTYDRNRRKNYHRRKESLDTTLRGFVKKTKKKVKPGYKKRIQRAIKEDEQEKRKLAKRHEMRKAKRQRQRQHRRERENNGR